MGCMEGACGGLAGAVLLAGLKCSDGDLDAPKSKGKTYQVTKEMVKRFQDKGGSIVCKDLKATVDGKQRYDCADLLGVHIVLEIRYLSVQYGPYRHRDRYDSYAGYDLPFCYLHILLQWVGV